MPKNEEGIEVTFISETEWWANGGTVLFKISFWRGVVDHAIHVEVRDRNDKRVKDSEINQKMISFIEATVERLNTEDEKKN